MSASRKPLDFFREKKPWSLQKDRILHEYVPAYLQKVSRNPGLPILVVDGFAGPGRFGSGDPGSPLILATDIAAAGIAPVPSLLAIEKHPALHAELEKNLGGFQNARVVRSSFDDAVADILASAKSCSTFLFLDPFAIAGLTWSSLQRLLAMIHDQKLSVEVLLNFNAHAFVRRARGAMAMAIESGDDGDEEDFDAWAGAEPDLVRLDEAVGGPWWRPILKNASSGPDAVDQLVRGLTTRLRALSQEACFYPVYGHWKHEVPKYFLVFATRSPVALVLMNDAMCKGHDEFLKDATRTELPLFGVNREALRKDPVGLDNMIKFGAAQRRSRDALADAVIERLSREQGLGLVSSGGVKRRIAELRDDGALASEPPAGRMNEKTIVWAR